MKRAVSLILAACYWAVGAMPSAALPERDFEQAMQEYRAAMAGAPAGSWHALHQRFARLRPALHQTPWESRAKGVELDCMAREAKPHLEAMVAVANTPDAPDWLLFAAGKALRQVRSPAALDPLQRLLVEFPSSALLSETLLALGEGMLPADPEGAEHYLSELARRFPDSPITEQALYLLALKGPESNRLTVQRFYRERYPEGAHRAAVARALSEAPGLTVAERLSLASDLLDETEYRAVQRLVKDLDSGTASFLLGKATWRLGDWRGGAALLHEAMERDPSLSAKSLLALGQLEEKRKDREAAAGYYRQAARDSGSCGLEALDRLGALSRKVDDESGAQEADRRVLERFPGTEEATEARWRYLWRSYQNGRYAEAKQWASAMGHAILVKVEGPAGAYWLGRLQEREGDRVGAIATYREVIRRKPRSYYGWRARHRLAVLQEGAKDPAYQVHSVPARVGATDLTGILHGKGSGREGAYMRALSKFPASLRELAYLGQVEPALHHAKRVNAEPNLRAWLALQAGRYAEAITAADGQDPYLTSPLGFYPQMKQAAEPQGLDPLLLTALVKQESHFDPRSRSWVGAMGLAQLMPFTASWVGRKVPGPVQSLIDPLWNLKLGAYYLAWLQHRLDDQPLYAVAAYNAGPNAVKKWRTRFGEVDSDVWVELIPYPETRHYVKKVFANLWTYQELYGF